MAVFMASDKASGMTGTTVNLTMGSSGRLAAKRPRLPSVLSVGARRERSVGGDPSGKAALIPETQSHRRG